MIVFEVPPDVGAVLRFGLGAVLMMGVLFRRSARPVPPRELWGLLWMEGIRAIGVYPECSEAWTNKASVLRVMGKFQEALECAEKALEIGPSPIAEALCDNLIDELRRKGIIR